MKVIIEMENLQSIIEESAKINTERAIEDAIRDVAREKVDNVLKDQIEEIVNNSIAGYVNDYLKSAKIKIGGGWKSDNVEEYTAEEYLKKQIGEVLDSQKFRCKYKDRWGQWTEGERTFKEYLEEYFNAEEVVKPYIEKMAKEMRDEVNRKIKSTFDNAMRTTLADNVFAIVSSNDTYRTITQNLKLLGE